MTESIGQHFKRAREARYLTLEKASEDTRIRSVFLRALEADDYSAMPSAAQGRGFLRNYAQYLALDVDEIIAEIQRRAPAPEDVSGPLEQVNLVEMEIPSLTEPEEKPAPHLIRRWLDRLSKKESAAGKESPLSLPEEEKLPEPQRLVDENPAEAPHEAKGGLIAKVLAFFPFRIQPGQPASIEEVQEPHSPELETPSVPSMPADVIFAEIGRQLRERRELISLTLDEVERHTHLRVVFLKAMEEGTLDRLPSPVQTRGMLANYAAFLNLDADTILLRFADVLQERRREKYAETPREKIQTEVIPSMPVLRAFMAGDLIFGVLMIGMLAVLAIWGIGRLVSTQTESETGSFAPVAIDLDNPVPLLTASPESTFKAVDNESIAISSQAVTEALSAAPVTATLLIDANVTVSIFSLERTFVRVSVDGEIAFEGRMVPRETKIFNAEKQVVVLTGNASALRITHNGQDLGLMGGMGEVLSRVYLVSGVATPTATIPPTPTQTQPATATSTPTPASHRTPTDGG